MRRFANALCGLLALSVAGCDGNAAPEVHLIPENYAGWVAVLFDETGVPLVVEDGARVYDVPDSGVLHLDAEFNDGPSPRGSVRYFETARSGERTELTRSWEAPVPDGQRAVWRPIVVGVDVSCRRRRGGLVYAVGTMEEYEAVAADVGSFIGRVSPVVPC
jgi:hypothetical protein